MTHWTPPPDRTELRELDRESAAAGALNRRWYVAAFAAGVLLVCLLGFSTDLFDSGPTNLEVSSAYRDGFENGAAAAEAYWEEELVDQWWQGYKRGQVSETSMAPIIVKAVREGFSWEGGYEAGLLSPDLDIDERYREGWMEGYTQGWAAVTGEIVAAPTDRLPETLGLTGRMKWIEWGGEP